MTHKSLATSLWIVSLAVGLAAYFFRHDALRDFLAGLSQSPPAATYGIYLLLGCVRGFTLVPVTYLVVAGLLVLPPVPLYVLTVAGILVSSASVYYFAAAMRFDRLFERRYGPHIANLRALMTRRELPIVVVWSFFPLAPTDLVCYVCGTLDVDVRKCLAGVVLGEGTICAIYIAAGGEALRWIR